MLKSQRLTAAVLIAAAIFLAACQSTPSIVGKWVGTFQGDTATMDFTDKGTCAISASGQTLNCTYTLDTNTKTPQR
jgi:predicted small secreted protein